MKRLTERLENGVINVKYASQHETAIHRLVTIEDILGDEYDLGRLKVIMDAERYGGLIVGYPPDDPGPKGPPGCCPNCGRYGGISWDAQTDVFTCALCGWTDAEAALRREQDEKGGEPE